MKRLLVAFAALLAIGIMVAAPALVAKDLVERPVANRNFDYVFAYIERLSVLRVDRARPVNRRLSGEGGSAVPVRCLSLRGGGRGWLCASLSTDGERFAAAWLVKRPEDRPSRLLAADKDDSTVPNP